MTTIDPTTIPTIPELAKQPLEERACLYFPGACNIEAFVVRGPSGDLVTEYFPHEFDRVQNDLDAGAILTPFREAVAAIEKANTEKYVKPWKEIDAAEWDEMLNVLPPERWESSGPINFFTICEYLTGNLTAFYARFSDRYFTATRPANTPGHLIAREVLTLLKP